MDLVENERRTKRQTFIAVIGIALAAMVMAPPIVEAAVQAVRIKKSVPLPLKKNTAVKVRNNGAIAGPQQSGALPTETLGKRQMVDVFSGGEGFWGAGFCGVNDTSPDPGEQEGDKVTVPAAAPGQPNNVVAGIIATSGPTGVPAAVTVKAPQLPTGDNPVVTIRTSPEQPTVSITLPSGLRVSPSALVFECQAGGPTGASFAVIGH